MPIVLVGQAYWRRAVDFDFLVSEGMIAASDRRLLQFADSAAQIWDAVAPSLGPAPVPAGSA
jgi:predicted Rossmann-fold nucleotide-binding protein